MLELALTLAIILLAAYCVLRLLRGEYRAALRADLEKSAEPGCGCGCFMNNECRSETKTKRTAGL
jgi:hypothetical protein